MQDFPHHYRVEAAARAEGDVTLSSGRSSPIRSAPPAEFGGPGDRWSPETLLVAAVADCFVLSFRAIARASKLDWEALDCEVGGTLDRVGGVTRFTQLVVRARLQVPAGTREDRARRLLEKAEASCLVTNSLVAGTRLELKVETAARGPAR